MAERGEGDLRGVAAYKAGEGGFLSVKSTAEWVTILRSHLVDAVATNPRLLLEKVPGVRKDLVSGDTTRDTTQ